MARDAVDNATSYGSLEKVRTTIIKLHVDAETHRDDPVTPRWTPQTADGYVGLDAPLG